ncbi:hypothetical protein [Sphingomonas radiodurans]|uniref:hypothetical protein n=1 Tax=Sphingomonas radiodurans TaxID=2890321 RepID=UPI001E2A2B99|nr:hypothetical protein [Sphingomonas radiodurans]WBH15030.1 hypothetical protein LLW23_09110 [Sphingomonas radiodurans]
MLELLGFPMAIQFKPGERAEWVYRKDQVGPALPTTREERDRYVRRFGWVMVTGPFLFFIVIAAGAWISEKFFSDASNALQVAISTIGAVAAFALNYFYLRYYGHAPARDFLGRTPVAPPLAMRVAHRRVLERMTNARLVQSVAILTGILGLSAFQPRISPADRPIALVFCLGLPPLIGFGFWLWRRHIANN